MKEKNLTLVEQALKLSPAKKNRPLFTEQEKDLVLAWAKDTVATKQVTTVMKLVNAQATYAWLLWGMKEIIRK